MFAIVEACGRQYQLEAGRFVDVDFARPVLADSALLIIVIAALTIAVPPDPNPTGLLKKRLHGAGKPSRASLRDEGIVRPF